MEAYIGGGAAGIGKTALQDAQRQIANLLAEREIAKREQKESRKARKQLLRDLKTAVADYMSSEGCSCCEGGDHSEHKAVIAKLLKVPKYDDGSGYDFNKFKTQP